MSLYVVPWMLSNPRCSGAKCPYSNARTACGLQPEWLNPNDQEAAKVVSFHDLAYRLCRPVRIATIKLLICYGRAKNLLSRRRYL